MNSEFRNGLPRHRGKDGPLPAWSPGGEAARNPTLIAGPASDISLTVTRTVPEIEDVTPGRPSRSADLVAQPGSGNTNLSVDPVSGAVYIGTADRSDVAGATVLVLGYVDNPPGPTPEWSQWGELDKAARDVAGVTPDNLLTLDVASLVKHSRRTHTIDGAAITPVAGPRGRTTPGSIGA